VGHLAVQHSALSSRAQRSAFSPFKAVILSGARASCARVESKDLYTCEQISFRRPAFFHFTNSSFPLGLLLPSPLVYLICFHQLTYRRSRKI